MSDTSDDQASFWPSEPRPKEPQRWTVRFPIETKRCKWCPATIVWTWTPATALKPAKRMPLTWASRVPVVENGQKVGFAMKPHWGDCTGLANRPRKGPFDR